MRYWQRSSLRVECAANSATLDLPVRTYVERTGWLSVGAQGEPTEFVTSHAGSFWVRMDAIECAEAAST